ncbi:MAG: flagellar biosynthesis protein FliS [Proteobacteria bacterium]|nr:flagellar biosynthesis protein FliS [Pseudomonadota bacterium]
MNDTSFLYRATMFDGEASLDWLRPGWRGLRLYGHRAKAAIEAGDSFVKADMISRADKLLTIMTGIVDSGTENPIGEIMLCVYDALRLSLLKANVEDDCSALDDFDDALRTLDRQFLKLSEMATEIR